LPLVLRSAAIEAFQSFFAQADSLDLRFPDSGILGRKILVLAVRPPVNLLKHLPGAIFAFSYVGHSYKSLIGRRKSGETSS
jgi:hypothetical protein